MRGAVSQPREGRVFDEALNKLFNSLLRTRIGEFLCKCARGLRLMSDDYLLSESASNDDICGVSVAASTAHINLACPPQILIDYPLSKCLN